MIIFYGLQSVISNPVFPNLRVILSITFFFQIADEHSYESFERLSTILPTSDCFIPVRIEYSGGRHFSK